MADRSGNQKASADEIVNDSGSTLSNDDGDGACERIETDTRGADHSQLCSLCSHEERRPSSRMGFK